MRKRVPADSLQGSWLKLDLKPTQTIFSLCSERLHLWGRWPAAAAWASPSEPPVRWRMILYPVAPCCPYVNREVPPQKWILSWATTTCDNCSVLTWCKIGWMGPVVWNAPQSWASLYSPAHNMWGNFNVERISTARLTTHFCLVLMLITDTLQKTWNPLK